MGTSRQRSMASAQWAVAVVVALLLLGTLCHRFVDRVRWGDALYETLYAIARMVAADDRGLSAGGRLFVLLAVLAGLSTLVAEVARLCVRAGHGT